MPFPSDRFLEPDYDYTVVNGAKVEVDSIIAANCTHLFSLISPYPLRRPIPYPSPALILTPSRSPSHTTARPERSLAPWPDLLRSISPYPRCQW